MKYSNAMVKVLAAVLWCGVSVGWNSAFAEYQMDAGDKMEKDAQGEMVLNKNPNADEIDREVCQVITDNINELAKYNVEWECGFPISANQYLLSKPEWVVATGEERNRAIIANYKTRPGYDKLPVDDPRFESIIKDEKRPIYGYPLNVDKTDADEKVYVMPLRSKQWVCGNGKHDDRISIWFAESNGMSLLPRLGDDSNLKLFNLDSAIYKNHLYFVGYNQGMEKDVFAVSTLKFIDVRPSKRKLFNTVCTISQPNPIKTK